MPSRSAVSDSASLVSFRDPGGYVSIVNGRVLRFVRQPQVADLEAFLSCRTAQKFTSAHRLVRTDVVDPGRTPEAAPNGQAADGNVALVVEHERITFPSFPYEWPPELLHDAGLLTLDLAEELVGERLGLKDATPYNVLFHGPEAIFVDVLSFERRQPGDARWLPYAQFARTFLLPLLANKYFAVPMSQIFATHRDGLEPEEVYRLCSPVRRLIPPFLGLVTVPTLLARKYQDREQLYRPAVLGEPTKAEFILRAQFRHLRRTLRRLAPRGERGSAWSEYMVSGNNYSDGQLLEKQQFVERALAEFRPRSVLDVGCNTGLFSALAAASGASVVAIDSDPVVVGHTWRRARSRDMDVLPLVVDLTRPSPGMGWRNRECAPFLERARGTFDAVLMLAVIHHMMVSERVPLAEVVGLAADLTRDLVVMEFISPADSMFRRLTRGRDHLFGDLTREVFEGACRERFEVVRSQQLSNANRWLYLLRKRDRPADA